MAAQPNLQRSRLMPGVLEHESFSQGAVSDRLT